MDVVTYLLPKCVFGTLLRSIITFNSPKLVFCHNILLEIHNKLRTIATVRNLSIDHLEQYDIFLKYNFKFLYYQYLLNDRQNIFR